MLPIIDCALAVIFLIIFQIQATQVCAALAMVCLSYLIADRRLNSACCGCLSTAIRSYSSLGTDFEEESIESLACAIDQGSHLESDHYLHRLRQSRTLIAAMPTRLPTSNAQQRVECCDKPPLQSVHMWTDCPGPGQLRILTGKLQSNCCPQPHCKYFECRH